MHSTMAASSRHSTMNLQFQHNNYEELNVIGTGTTRIFRSFHFFLLLYNTRCQQELQLDSLFLAKSNEIFI